MDDAKIDKKHPLVLVLTVIPAELEAAKTALGLRHSDRHKDDAGTVWYLGQLQSALTRIRYNVAVGCLGTAGNSGAAAGAADAIHRLRPRAVLLMGIAAGIRGKTKIGDVVLSERVIAYEPAAIVSTDQGPREQRRPEMYRTAHSIAQDVINYSSDGARLREIFAAAGGSFPSSDDTTRDADFAAYVATNITVRIATIASGEKLLRDPSKLRSIREDIHGKVEVGEMEAAGLAEACVRAAVPWLVVRGISDFGDDLKDDRFHIFASMAAATVVADFIAQGLDLSPTKPRLPSWILLVAAMLAVGTAIHYLMRPAYAYRGTVTDTATQQRISGAEVRFPGTNCWTKTDLIGFFVIDDGVCARQTRSLLLKHELEIKLPGHTRWCDGISIPPDVDYDVRLNDFCDHHGSGVNACVGCSTSKGVDASVRLQAHATWDASTTSDLSSNSPSPDSSGDHDADDESDHEQSSALPSYGYGTLFPPDSAMGFERGETAAAVRSRLGTPKDVIRRAEAVEEYVYDSQSGITRSLLVADATHGGRILRARARRTNAEASDWSSVIPEVAKIGTTRREVIAGMAVPPIADDYCALKFEQEQAGGGCSSIFFSWESVDGICVPDTTPYQEISIWWELTPCHPDGKKK